MKTLGSILNSTFLMLCLAGQGAVAQTFVDNRPTPTEGGELALYGETCDVENVGVIMSLYSKTVDLAKLEILKQRLEELRNNPACKAQFRAIDVLLASAETRSWTPYVISAAVIAVRYGYYAWKKAQIVNLIPDGNDGDETPPPTPQTTPSGDDNHQNPPPSQRGQGQFEQPRINLGVGIDDCLADMARNYPEQYAEFLRLRQQEAERQAGVSYSLVLAAPQAPEAVIFTLDDMAWRAVFENRDNRMHLPSQAVPPGFLQPVTPGIREITFVAPTSGKGQAVNNEQNLEGLASNGDSSAESEDEPENIDNDNDDSSTESEDEPENSDNEDDDSSTESEDEPENSDNEDEEMTPASGKGKKRSLSPKATGKGKTKRQKVSREVSGLYSNGNRRDSLRPRPINQQRAAQ